MNLKNRIRVFNQLGDYLRNNFYIDNLNKIAESGFKNPWFTDQNIRQAIDVWGEQLRCENLDVWLDAYKLEEIAHPKKVLIIMAGNIPLVGFHDFLSVMLTGNSVVIKLSSNDNILLPIIINKLIEIEPLFQDYIQFSDHIGVKDFDAIIATGSDNSAKHFEYYFKDIKKIIRKNRRSVAILDGYETEEELNGLANDVFSYFGLGCRNVSKLFLPLDYDIDRLFKAFYPYKDIINNSKYCNNYDYNKAVFLMGSHSIVENGFLMLKEDTSYLSPVSVLYYEYYDDVNVVLKNISDNVEKLQCVVSKKNIPFGNSQKPNLWDYSDGVDTIKFLINL